MDRPEVIQRLREHVPMLAQYSPPGSMHAPDLGSLRRPEITFSSVWGSGGSMGAGRWELHSRHGEIISMRTVAKPLRQGVAARRRSHIFEEASRRAYQRLSLETGATAACAPARRL